MGYPTNRLAVTASLEVPVVIDGVTVGHYPDLPVLLLLGADDDLEDIELEGERDYGLGSKRQVCVYVSQRSSTPFAAEVWKSAVAWLDTPAGQSAIDDARMDVLSAA